jgi:hypothetical protein
VSDATRVACGSAKGVVHQSTAAMRIALATDSRPI